MISVVIMAGYNNKREVKKYAKFVAEHYGEKFIETGYKPLREFRTVIDGKKVSKPLIQYTLETLSTMNEVSDVVIAGHRMLLEQRLEKFIKAFNKPCRIINQNKVLGNAIIKEYGILPRKVKHNSIAGNFIKGYAATQAFQEKKHALFIASDSPLTTTNFIRNFIQIVEQFEETTAISVPAVLLEGEKDRLGRFPLKLLNDTEYVTDGRKDTYGRQGFRLSPLLYANPHMFDVNMTNTAYNLRKLLIPNVQLRLFKVTRRLGYPNVYSKYFLRKDLSVKEVANITSAFFRGPLMIIPIRGEEATYDYDGTELEYRMISDMLSSD